ncbi:energy transducer TonB [Thiocystis violacea]|uniref:energy transducer TonB n=1 Tax=Thiocystis violacea TaxID=13725 RepID=UPI001902FA00|nr:energy transducer TonB [Thiocystis violacea]MBK1723318.1 hypothetical protein [Thiocystis violacea]
MTAYADQLERPERLASQRNGASQRTFVAALVAAALLHLLLIVGVSFAPAKPKPPPETALEVLIIKERGQSIAQASPDAMLSQRDRAGESLLGDAAQTSEADSEAEPHEQAPPDARSAEAKVEEEPTPAPAEDTSPPLHSTVLENTEVEPKVTTSLIPVEKTAPVLSARTTSEMPPVAATDALRDTETRVDAAQILASRGMEISRLTASLEAKSSAYAKRVRRKSISASTREFKYASYLSAWARKVERIGNINYPQAAKTQRIYGSLILHVAVRSDGSVEQIRVVKSSGYDLLDEAAIQIVELAAPFSPFPPDIAAETDVLDVIRTWQFTRGNVLGWER